MGGGTFVRKQVAVDRMLCFLTVYLYREHAERTGQGEASTGDLFVCAFRMGAAACFKRARLKDYSEKRPAINNPWTERAR